jgi:transposase-like protein
MARKRQEKEGSFSTMSHRKQHDGRFKAQVALEAIKNQQTTAQIASEYGVNPAQVSL